MLCMHVYDEALGDADSGIQAGTLWENVPDDWVCPKCGAAKKYFSEESQFS
jgi:rubredoxin